MASTPTKSPHKTRMSADNASNKALDITSTNRALVASEENGCTFLSVQASGGQKVRISTPIQFHNEERSFVTSQMLLHDQTSKALFLTPDRNNIVVRADVERGTTLDQFSMFRNGREVALPLRSFALNSKFGGLDAAQTVDLVAVGNESGNCLLHATYDPRTPNRVVEIFDDKSDKGPKERTAKVYAGRSFACIATSREGYVVAGDSKGAVALYDDVRKTAKAKFDQLADPVTGVDITSDGEWVVWSTKQYHVLLGPLGEAFWKGKKKGKDVPFVVVKLDPKVRADLKLPTEEVLAPAMFDCEIGLQRDTPGVVESRLLSSVGSAVLVWSLRQLQRFAKEGGGNWTKRPTVHQESGAIKALHGEYDSSFAVAALEQDVRRMSIGQGVEEADIEEESSFHSAKDDQDGDEDDDADSKDVDYRPGKD